jgi:hypothetical protein
MKDINFRRLRFEMERIGLQHRVSNMELEFMEDVQRRELVITLGRRVAVNRQVFENKDRKPEVTSSFVTVTAALLVPASWWDHAKLELPLLQWAVRRRWLAKPVQGRRQEQKRVETERTERHYIEVVTVLHDQKEIPAHQQSIEIGYEPLRADGRPAPKDYRGGYDALDMD